MSSSRSSGAKRGAGKAGSSIAKRQKRYLGSAGTAVAGGSVAKTQAIDPTRVRILLQADKDAKDVKPNRPVVYWMSRDQRVRDNYALLYAQQQAIANKAPLAVVFNLVRSFCGIRNTARTSRFMLKGLAVVEEELCKINIPFFLVKGLDQSNPVKDLVQFLKDSECGLLVVDHSPLREPIAWKQAVQASACVPHIHQVDAHNIVPVWIASDKLEWAARTIRPKINAALDHYLTDMPAPQVHPVSHATACKWPAAAYETSKQIGHAIDWEQCKRELLADDTVPEVSWILPGEHAAAKGLADFLKPERMKLYAKRNDPTIAGAVSNFSPWLRFGHLSAQRVAFDTKSCGLSKRFSESVSSFLEELVVRRELSENFCFYNPHGYDRLDGLYPKFDQNSWAQKTLKKHANDPREYVYSREEWEQAQTHDDLWNAAQLELLHVGKIQGFMRMYWAKKILEWTDTPEHALEIAIYLNDKYELDGRDPNGFVGCSWAIAGVHDRAWTERSVFGMVRYMNFNGCRRKFDVDKYIRQVSATVKQVTGQKPTAGGKSKKKSPWGCV